MDPTAGLFTPNAGVAGSTVQRIFFHVPEGALWTLGSGSTTAVGRAVGEVVGVAVGIVDADADADADANADADADADAE